FPEGDQNVCVMYAGSTEPPQPQACAVAADTRVTTAVAVAISASFPICTGCWCEVWVMVGPLLDLGVVDGGSSLTPWPVTYRLSRTPWGILNATSKVVPV